MLVIMPKPQALQIQSPTFVSLTDGHFGPLMLGKQLTAWLDQSHDLCSRSNCKGWQQNWARWDVVTTQTRCLAWIADVSFYQLIHSGNVMKSTGRYPGRIHASSWIQAAWGYAACSMHTLPNLLVLSCFIMILHESAHMSLNKQQVQNGDVHDASLQKDRSKQDSWWIGRCHGSWLHTSHAFPGQTWLMATRSSLKSSGRPPGLSLHRHSSRVQGLDTLPYMYTHVLCTKLITIISPISAPYM